MKNKNKNDGLRKNRAWDTRLGGIEEQVIRRQTRHGGQNLLHTRESSLCRPGKQSRWDKHARDGNSGSWYTIKVRDAVTAGHVTR